MNNSRNLSEHILTVSSTMVGVCVTVISVIQIVPTDKVSRFVDEMLAFDALLFLFSTMLSYWALRHTEAKKIEAYADRLFISGMVLMVIVSFFVAFDLFIH